MSTEIDWKAIKRDYCANKKSLRAIAAARGCAESSIRKQAKKEKWARKEKAGAPAEKKVRTPPEKTVRKTEVRTEQLPAVAPKVGKPPVKSPELLETLCDAISIGASAHAACKKIGIDRRTLYKWLAEDEEFGHMYARAKEDGVDYLAEEIIEIADYAREDTYTTDDGTVKVDNEIVRRSQLRIDARKWYAAKLAPRKYGERVFRPDEDDGNAPITNIEIVFVQPNGERAINPGRVVQIEGTRTGEGA